MNQQNEAAWSDVQTTEDSVHSSAGNPSALQPMA